MAMYKFSEDFVSNCKNPIWLAAQELSYYNVPVFPCKPDKSPKIKNGFKGATKDWATVRKWFQSEDDMIGVPMGNVTCLDIDAKNQPGLVEAFEKSLDDAGLTVIRETLVMQTTINGGAHYFFRVKGLSEPVRNLVLSRSVDNNVTIETRGDGGYAVVAPSKGYRFVRGSLPTIPTITLETFQAILTVAKSFDRCKPKESKPTAQQSTIDEDSPGDDYNRRGADEMLALLQSDGWKPCKDLKHWTRPGKNAGTSATWDSPETPNKFYVFTSNAAPFEAFTSYSPFAVYAMLQHGGDYSAAAKALFIEGYGDRKTKSEIQVPYVSASTTEPSKATKLVDKLRASVISEAARISELRKQAVEQVEVLPWALRGQATVIYMEANGGKTLLTLNQLAQSVKAGRVDGSRIFYILADDDYRGSVEKANVALQSGFNLLVPGLVDGAITLEEIPRLLEELASSGEVAGYIIVLDTLKKVVSMMDKSRAADFGKLVRRFVQAGGTFIALAHVNKHKGDDGKPIYEGTGDIINDFDCAYTGTLDTPKDEADRQVTFVNQKLRGDVPLRVSVRYDSGRKSSWLDKFNSVNIVSEDDALKRETELRERQQLARDELAVAWIRDLLSEGTKNTTQIKTGGCPHLGQKQIVDILYRYSDSHRNPQFRFWTGKSAPRNAQIWALTDKHPEAFNPAL